VHFSQLSFVFEEELTAFYQLRAFKWLSFDVHLPNALNFIAEFKSRALN
jgi:hypothetical protein